uniref:Uncharacterized protein n=1 Tax=Ficedula albicollis TaxID=59894 RepID=A0A803VPK5_FICAL
AYCCCFCHCLVIPAVSHPPQGSILGDFCSVWWCGPCALCQLKRDINRRREMGIFW